MGSYNFRWEHPADTVYVTGTFDNWSGNTHKLDKVGSIHEKTVALPATDKILYKFVADGTWIHDHTANTEADSTGNLNNVIHPHEIMSHTLNSSGPGATTNALAGAVPLEKKEEQVIEDTPGAFPVTPGAEQTFSVNPIAASEGSGNPISLAPGETVPTLAGANVASGVHDDPELVAKDQTVSVAPIPATPGYGNPVSLAPGEAVPPHQTLTGSTLTSNVKLDQASYENSDAAATTAFPASAQTIDRDAASAAAEAGLGNKNIIPESSLGVDSNVAASATEPHISSVGASSTTADLAGAQPILPRQEATVIDEDKDTSKSTGIAGAAAGGLAAVGAAAAGAAVYLNQKGKETTGVDAVSKLPDSIQSSIKDMNASSNTAAGVPSEVAESQKAAHVAPEAAANPEAVQEKSAVEKELLAKVPTAEPATGTAAAAVPAEVLASQQKAHVAPEASANPEAVTEKTALEKELLSKVAPTQSAGEPAPTVTAATTATAPVAAAATTTSTTIAPGEHVGIAPAVSAHGAPQLGKVGPHAPINLDEPLVAPSGDVSPLTTPAIATEGDAAKNGSVSTAGKRGSIFGKLNKPAAESSQNANGTQTTGTEKKKKGLFTRIKEKLHK